MTIHRAFIFTCDVCTEAETIQADYKPAAIEEIKIMGWLDMYGRNYCPSCMDVNQHLARDARQVLGQGGGGE